MKRAISGLLASALVMSFGVRAARADKPKKVIVEQFSGAGADQFKKLVAGALGSILLSRDARARAPEEVEEPA